MSINDIVGYIAATLGTFLMLPQVIRTIRTKHAGDVSEVMLIIYVVQCILWAIYGFGLHSVPIWLCNVIGSTIGFVQLGLKHKYASATK